MAQTSIFKILYVADYTQAAGAINAMQARIHKQETMIRKLGTATGTVTKQTGKMGGAMTKAGHAIHGVSKKTGGAVTHFNRAEAGMGKMILSAIKWAAVFTVVYGVIRGLMGVIQGLVGAILNLDQAMADIASVTNLTGKELEKALGTFRKAIVSYAAESRESIKDMTRSIYLLETAGLDVQTALKGFPHVMNLVTATMGKTEETTKIMAGLYNTLAANIEGATTAEEKFEKMSDVLAYTIAREQVLIGELQQGMQYIAPEATAVSDTFTELVTVIGFLNTKMLKGSKAGRLMARQMMQLIKNADKMKEILGVTYDPEKPLNFLAVMKEIKNQLGDWGKITTEQRDILREIFAMRGGRPAMLMVAFFNELEESISKAKTGSEGFSKAMKEIRELTVKGQFARMHNIFEGIAVTISETMTPSKEVAANLYGWNEALKDDLKTLLEIKNVIDTIRPIPETDIAKIAAAEQAKEMSREYKLSIPVISQLYTLLIGVGGIAKYISKEFGIQTEEVNKLAGSSEQWNKYMDAIGKNADKLTNNFEKTNEILTYQAKLARDRWSFENKLVSKVLEHELSLRKKMGEEEEDIARARIKAFEAMDLPLAEKVLGVTDARFKLESAILNKILEQRDAVGSNMELLEKLFKAREEMGIYERRTGKGRAVTELMEYAVGRKEYKDLSKKAKEEYPIYFPERARERGITEILEREGVIPSAPTRPAAGRMPSVTRAEAIAREIAQIVVNQDIKNRINIGGVSIEVQPGMTAEQIGKMAQKAIEEAYRDAQSKIKKLSDESIADYE